MSDVQLYLVECEKDRDEAQKLAARSANRLAHGELKLLDLIEQCGEYINNDEPQLRRNSLAYLADVLSQAPPKTFSGQQRKLLCDFILSRVQDDTEGKGSCARALMALEERGKWDQDTASRIVDILVSDAQTLRDNKLQSDRFAILQLLDLLLAKYRKAVKTVHEGDHAFLGRFILYFDGEKDPRNLMVAFSILQVPMTEWELGPYAQELFDSVFNYFPITFKPPPGDPYGITAQDLKNRLRDCIASTSEFAPYAFPALLDKLDSSSMNTKRDVLEAIKACVTNYEPRTVSLYSVTLWDALKFEILSPQEEDLAETSLEILSLIARQLALAGQGALNAYLKPVLKECNEHLEDAPTKQSQAAGQILKNVAKASPIIADSVSKAVIPHLFQLFNSSESISKRRGLIEVLNELIEATVDVSSQWRVTDAEGQIVSDRAESNAFRDYSTEVLEALLRAVVNAPKSEISFRLFALKGLVGMIKIRKLLNDADVARIINACTDIIIEEKMSVQEEVEDAAVKGLTEIARYSPGVTAERAVPVFLAELPDTATPGSGYERILEAFAKLSTEPQMFDIIILRLKNKLAAAVKQKADNIYIHALLAAILFAFTSGSPGTEEGVIRFSYFTDIVKPFLDQATGRASEEASILTDETSVDVIGRICNIIIRPQSNHYQNQIFAEYEPLFRAVGTEEVASAASATLVASLHLHAALQRDVVAGSSPTSLLSRLVHVATSQSTSPFVRSLALRHVSLVVNKFISPSDLEQSLVESGTDVQTLLRAGLSPDSVKLGFAVAKGLVVQGKSAKYTNSYMQSLLELLSEPTYGGVAARGFVTILAPDDILTKENHCLISALSKQKIFNQTVPIIATTTKVVDTVVKSNYLVALSGILRWLSYSLIESSLPTLVPLLLQTLDLQEHAHQDVKAATLVTLEHVTVNSAPTISEHASSFISRLLACTAAPENTYAVRKGALRCLTLVPAQFKRETVIPYRRQVIKRLLACLDDKKRAVRAEAVRCRAAWLSLDQDDSDED